MTSISVGLVACSGTKLREAAPARDLYQGALFRKAAAYCDGAYDRWFILSAKHYLVAPGEVLDPYNLTLKGRTVADIAHWASMVESGLRLGHGCLTEGRHSWPVPSADRLMLGAWIQEGREQKLTREAHLWFHAGADYVDPLLPLLSLIPEFVIHTPLRGLGIGEQLHWYAERR